MELSNFEEKYNYNSGSAYEVEEKVTVVNGAADHTLSHGNVVEDSILVYTGAKQSGSQITSFTTSTVPGRAWRTAVHITTSESEVYVSYESTGDTVDAEDVNEIHTAIKEAQEAHNSEVAAVKKSISGNEDSITNLGSRITQEISDRKAGDAGGTAALASHNVSSSAHADIRKAIADETEVRGKVSNIFRDSEDHISITHQI
ncbi:MAG: hypothetical protein SPL54_00470 [Lachnospiraceae bacterium]|nr:hypothetical protein [Lachnospiraceae bacterium]